MNESEYRITEEDVLAMLKHLRHVAPEYATPENATMLLEWRHSHYKSIEELYPELIVEILHDLEAH